MEIIKLYRNRKLYSTKEGCYVTLVELQQKVLSNQPFKVITNMDRFDVTNKVLCKILHKQDLQASFGTEGLISRIKAHPTTEIA